MPTAEPQFSVVHYGYYSGQPVGGASDLHVIPIEQWESGNTVMQLIYSKNYYLTINSKLSIFIVPLQSRPF